MEALNRTHRVVVLASDHERQAWSDFAQARGMRLGPFIRLAINNATGVNDPPELDAFTDDDLARYSRMVVSGADLRTLLREERRPRARYALLLVGLAVVVLADFALQVGGALGFWRI